MNKDTTTSGAADLPEALRRSTAADGKTELFNLPGYPLMVRAVDFNRLHAESEMRRAALLDEMQKAALAAGQATAAQAVVQDDLITIRKPTTSAEMLWLLKLAHLVISGMDKTLEEAFAPAQPAARQVAAYATLPENYYLARGEVPTWDAKRMHAFADATCALRASHGQAPAGAQADSVQEDSARLDWLDKQIKAQDLYTGFGWRAEGSYEENMGLVGKVQAKKEKMTARQAIDAARAAQKEGE